ncbi:MAG: HTH domain-containing protein [Nitrososphaeria archaeon]
MRLLTQNELILYGNEAHEIIQALSTETGFKILQLLAKERLDISTIASRLNVSESYVSEEIKKFEKLNLVKVTYTSGKRGIKKVCELNVSKITILLKKKS